MIRNALTTCLVSTCLIAYDLPAAMAADPPVVASAPVSGNRAATAAPPASGLAALGASTGKAVGAAMSTYANARYGYAIDYPEGMLTPGAEADDGDGLVFQPRTGTGRVAAWGRYNATDDTPAELLHGEEEGACGGAPASYEVSKSDLVAFSCRTPHDGIVYEKMVIRDETIAVVSFTYPAEEQTVWEPVIKEMAGSLRIGQP